MKAKCQISKISKCIDICGPSRNARKHQNGLRTAVINEANTHHLGTPQSVLVEDLLIAHGTFVGDLGDELFMTPSCAAIVHTLLNLLVRMVCYDFVCEINVSDVRNAIT